MPIAFTINGDTADEVATAIKSFAEVLRGDIKAVSPAKPKNFTADATKFKGIQAEDTPPPAAAADDPAIAVEKSEISYTLEQVRTEATEAAKVHGREVLKTLLNDLGVSGLTELQAELYPEFMSRLKALGGNDA